MIGACYDGLNLPESAELRNQAEYGSTLSLREFDVYGGQRQQFLV